MAIEIIPKKDDSKEGGLKKNIYYFSMTILIISILLSLVFFLFGLSFRREEGAIKERIKDQKTGEMLALEKKIDTYYTKIKNLPNIVERDESGKRKSVISFFEAIESATHPLVYWSEFKINSLDRKVNAMGVARNILVFDQQLRFLERNESISRFDVLNFDIQEDRTVIFPIVIEF